MNNQVFLVSIAYDVDFDNDDYHFVPQIIMDNETAAIKFATQFTYKDNDVAIVQEFQINKDYKGKSIRVRGGKIDHKAGL